MYFEMWGMHTFPQVADDGRSECDADLLAISELGIHEKVNAHSTVAVLYISCRKDLHQNTHMYVYVNCRSSPYII